MARNDLFVYKAPDDQDILANDGSSFSSPTFREIRRTLAAFSSLKKTQYAEKVPYNYEEDAVQISRRDNFDLKEWILTAASIDKDGVIKTILLVHQTHQEEGLVLSYPSCGILSLFYRGFLVQEFYDEPAVNGDDFLFSIGVKEELSPLKEGYESLDEDDEENPIIEVIRPKFTANKKNKIVNLGGSYIQELPKEKEDDEEEEIHIVVEHPAFSANSKKKIPNLGSSSKKPREIIIEEEEEEEPVNIEPIERPAFEARSSKKPINLNAKPLKKKIKEPQKKKEEPAPVEEEAIAPIEIERPAFEARKQGAIRNLDEHHKEMNKTIEVEAVGEVKKPRPHVEEVVPEPIKNNWVAIDVFKLKPKVFSGERAVIASPKDEEAKKLVSLVSGNLSELKSIRISLNCVFTPEVIKEDDPRLSLLSSFDFSSWRILAITVNSKEEPLYALLEKKDEYGVSTLVSFKHKGPHIVMFSTKGASVDDRALPYFSYDDLRKIAA